ncbi:MAG: lasso peptide biosynthesis B2 protein [Lachnospiraceae bacterium]|nr:lasso peptide biosynthesis B2 protein [Lachnospiraceae bacterium]MBR5994190.1 lasso peptide biosynthesis B2 protein [Lachnospiraceae bacterium]
MRNPFTRVYRFFRYNNDKWLSLQCWYYSAVYRFKILHMNTEKLKDNWGERGVESPATDTEEHYTYAWKVSYNVSQVCGKTSWESKCLVRAWTAQTLLAKKGIHSTLYLGCGYDQDKKMVAHSWLRCGEKYITGGNGEGYAMVDKFSK